MTTLTLYALFFVILLFSIITHEVAHAYAASFRGDHTARALGRTTFNPFVHADLFGTIILPALLLIMQSGILFGWAKPVPINTSNFSNPRLDMAIVSASGPLSHFVLAALAGVVLHVFMATPLAQDPATLQTVGVVCAIAIRVNVILGILNLVPIPPLDGSKILYAVLPADLAIQYSRLERYGFIIVLVLVMSGILFRVLGPLIQMLINLFSGGLVR
ncbi:MAG: site-2 protease family protein [Elusimicrobia bacterium]|nr:site-2 protease family protein [Elusimicrobiota bacterium]